MDGSLYYLLSLSLCFTVGVSGTNFSDCATKLSTLELALYETGDNLFEITQAFFPPSTRTSRYIRVTYIFLEDDNINEDQDCNVTYIWAVGGFLFFQPPTLFEYNSLFFNYPNNNLTDIPIVLPAECRPIVEADGQCSCSQRNTQMLDVLTQQLDVYASYTCRTNVEREHSFARAVCSGDLFEDFYSGNNRAFVYSIVSLTIVLPIIFCIAFCASIRHVNNSLITLLVKPSNHATIVSLALLGFIISTSIIIVDILACYTVVTSNFEYETELTETDSINLGVVYATLILDILFFLPSLLSLLFLIYINATLFFGFKGKHLSKIYLSCCVALVGPKSAHKFDAEPTAAIFPFMFISPILCLSSHAGYILLAWLTEPSKSVAVFLLYYIGLFSFFFILRSLYSWHSKLHVTVACSRKDVDKSEPEGATTENIRMEEIMPQDQQKYDSNKEDLESVKKHTSCCFTSIKKPDNKVNTQAFCVLIFYAILIIGIFILVTLTFVLLPIASQEIATYFFNALQLLVVLISTQFFFKVYLSTDFSLQNIVENFRAVYAKKEATRTNEKLLDIAKDENILLEEATGAFVAEFADVVVHKLE